MQCPFCDSQDIKTIDAGDECNKHECKACGELFYT